MLGCSIVLPYGVLLRTAFVKNWSAPARRQPLARALALRVLRVQPDASWRSLNTFILGATAATAGTILVDASSAT